MIQVKQFYASVMIFLLACSSRRIFHQQNQMNLMAYQTWRGYLQFNVWVQLNNDKVLNLKNITVNKLKTNKSIIKKVKMKPHKNGLKKTTSFISNKQLIQNMRNRSARNLIINDSKQKNREKQKSKDKHVNISLIQPKKYHQQSIKNILNLSNIHDYDSNSYRVSNYQTAINNINNYSTEDQNINPNINLKLNKSNPKQSISNMKSQTSIISKLEDKKQDKSDSLLKFLKQNISNKKLISQVQNLLQQQSQQKKQISTISKQEAALLAKIQELYIEKTRIKRQKKQQEQKFKQQIKQYIQREEQLKKENQRLHRLVLKQSQMITNQANNEIDASQDLKRILLTQAKAIECLEGMGKKSRTSANSSVIKSR